MRLFLHGQSPTSTLLAQLNDTRQSRITSLYLSSWSLVSPKAENSLLLAFSEFFREHQGMTEVILRNCSGDNLMELVILILDSSPQALTIRYDQQQHLPYSVAQAFVHGCQSRIQRLNLQGITLDTDLLEAFEFSLPEKFRNLATLSIKSNLLLRDADQGVSILGQGNDSESYFAVEDAANRLSSLLLELPNLECLELENCHLNDEQLAMLTDAALSSCDMRILNLSGNQCQEATMSILSKHLSRPEATMETLDLTWQRLPNEAASTPLPRPTMISVPKFRTTQPMNGIALLAIALRTNSSLRNLILSENKIREGDIEMLTEALVVNNTLESLEMKDCRLRSNSLRCLANSLPKLRLKTLQIDGCQKLSPRHEEKALRSLFLVPLAKNQHMEDLGMNYRSQSIDWLLDWNRSGRPEVDQSLIPSSLGPTIAGMQGHLFQMITS
ncbi:unnamed protein product [Cylindrotheca closterium]|uniref:Uncharacterized protein n=1 Tax=Cylindrotheca closterium TaxID=2856 RepID=A0AAD2G9D3_9STRA|nr:unnamed protein product [Cylindrotheca closterium]